MSEKKKERGRPSTKYNEKELYAIVYHYRENVRPQGNIKYLQLYKYHLELSVERPDICSGTYSEDFWRKKGQPGREIIDIVNKIRTVTLVDCNNNNKDIPNVVDVVHKYLKDPEKLIKHLTPLENEVRRSIDTERKLKEKNEELKHQLKQEIEIKRELREQVLNLKECIFKLFHYSDKDGTPIENLLNMNNKNLRIKRALDEAFSFPQNFYTELENFQQQEANIVIKKDNIISLNSINNKPKRTIEDDFEGRF
ncbi:hypothetical protein [Lysinibacillus fusiformis]|uniref:hypothetical protein n=1 Tax=Lysinibacillus fusiformis TaxID=28031 RepID=UPI0012472666|nr:hypothetical protein [Lysinibacillus fusiformis]KAB0443976.1 hypothetical protein CH314_10260 [Lysinibacillus fusiformis]